MKAEFIVPKGLWVLTTALCLQCHMILSWEMLTGKVVSVTRKDAQVHGLPDIGERRCNAGDENENMLQIEPC